MDSDKSDMNPTPDAAEDNAFFPSPYSLAQFTSQISNLSDAEYSSAYKGGRWKVLVIGADERYLLLDNGTFFSTGNHPIETLLPMYHLHKAGFGFDFSTLSGYPIKFELWAMPRQDTEVMGLYKKYNAAMKSPRRLGDVVRTALGQNSDYMGVFIPGGHGALIGLPESSEMRALLEWVAEKNKFLISICHGPAAFLAVGEESPLYRGKKIVAFPDAMDAKTPEIGYMPGHLTWKFGEKLKRLGFEILNNQISGQVHKDGKILTGDSPLAGNALGKMAAQELLAEVNGRD
ncbi:protein deglycase HchA [Haematospirillum jordaniae]|uniref:glyoxalase III HchA n=1 Tax=Haematospirillum jordaniae TaxID=1549855 RepID=UPI001432A6CE|nr:glyoxalase III HchA [Haematospirillum jordaniae]NKD84989.1 protein deglycase HchA [Haematospirillum jordaniae]